MMPGFPPPIAERWTLATWQLPPYNRTTFHSLREVVPTARVSRGAAAPRPLPSGPEYDLQRCVPRTGGSDSTVAQILAATYTDGFLVLCDGEVVAEEYPACMAPDRTHMLMSVSKSLVGCVAAVLLDRGVLNLHAPLTAHVPELVGSGYDGATVRNVLDMRSGIAFSEDYLDGDAEVRVLEQVIGWAPRVRADLPTSMYEYLCTLSGTGRHGGPFSYRSCETDVLGWVCERASGVRMPELLSDVLWSRLAPEYDADAAVDSAGAVMHDGGLAVTLRDLGRFGQLLLDDGRVGDQQVVPAWWLADSYTGDHDSRAAFAASENDQRMPGGMYRNQFWVPFPDRDLLLCLGIHGQLVYVDPTRRVVAAKLSSWPYPQDAGMLDATLAAIATIAADITTVT
jgi:CubicO group peptidase (beta-lactamase class C family)